MINEKAIRRILTALSEAVDKENGYTEVKPDIEKGEYKKVSDTGNHEMDADPSFSSVTDTKGAKKIETKPAFSSIKDPGADGGAKTNAKEHKQKNPYKESVEVSKPEINEEEELDEASRNMKALKGENPALRENEDCAPEKIEESLSPENKARAQRLRETIEVLTGKKVVYKA